MNRRLLRDTHNITLTVTLLSVLMAGSLSPGAVLCIGSDGHVAIEPADHEHCGHAVSDGAAHTAHLATAWAPYSGHDHCRPCTDIPIPAGYCDPPFVTDRFEADDSLLAGSFGRAAAIVDDLSGGVAACDLEPGLIPFYVPLDSVILIV